METGRNLQQCHGYANTGRNSNTDDCTNGDSDNGAFGYTNAGCNGNSRPDCNSGSRSLGGRSGL
ncbi:hypothetical protein D3C75_1249880 [compost metagenome]